MLLDHFRATTKACGYGSPRSRGRRMIWRVFALVGHAFRISRLYAPEVCLKLPYPPNRGRREHRVHAAPAVSCAKLHKGNAHEHTGSANGSRERAPDDRLRQSGIPCAMVLTAY